MLPKTLSFVDVETTGLSSTHGRIIEIGILRVEDGIVVDQLSSLVNPGTHVDPFILGMTGINSAELEDAPSFYSLKNQIKSLLDGAIFVAHSAMFDYSFIKKEFERLEESFSAKCCCSVKLSKKLYPKFKHHNLDSLIERFGFECERRHRAFDDAKVIFDFYQQTISTLGPDKLAEAIRVVMKRPSLPMGITEQMLDALPESAGVYIFYNKDNVPLYIGKSIGIRSRVLSHFASTQEILTDMKIANDVVRIETIETAGELGALLLEATLVKKMQPLYNRQLRYAFKLLALKKTINEDGYSSVSVCNLNDVPIEELGSILGIFKSQKELREFLRNLAKEYNLCLKNLGVEKTQKSCFNYHLGLCFGACEGREKNMKYNLRFEEAFYKTKIKDWPFKGPIALKEKSLKEEIFVIDKWCVLGSIKNEGESLEDIQRDYFFDTDTYKILNRYLNAKKDFEVFNLT